ncbi:MAG: PD-(D/E)XK nuclease family protein, partial [Treponema sp.]|nr:PD-(D/E)XK nuclease family protein [Treponema sp.]
VSWNDIAISVPGIQHYKPYIQREFEKYAIPCAIRVGNSYTVNNAGRIFENIRECKLNNFSYDSVRSLLLNCYIPWKDKDINENLIREGNRLHCVCSFEENPGEILDIWNATLSKIPEDERELTFYKILKDDINRICNSKTFSQIRDGWFTFKNHFLKEDEFTIEANNILSRCIEELEALISIEKDFIIPLELNVTSPFDFFINELNTKSYRPQEKIKGVSIFDYKLVACSAYKYHIVMNCSQSNLSIPYRPLSFLNNEKRKQLGIFDEDVASSAFIRLYAKNICKSDSQNYTIFTCSEESFEGFAIPHNFFAISKADDCLFETLDKNDFIKAEEKLFMKDEIPFAISTKQQNEFLKWKNAADYNNNSEYVVDSSVQEKIKFALSDNRSKKLDSQFDGKMIISQSDMAKFFPCPRKWLLNDILKLKDDSLEINLLQPYDIGNINHKILEIVFSYFKKNNLLIPAIQEDESFGNDEELVRKVVSDAVEKAINSYEMNFKDSYLVLAVLESQKSKFEEGIIKFLRSFCNVEKGFGGKKIYALEKWYSSLAENQEFGLTGRIDSILADDEGKLSVIDYKNTLSGISSKQYIVDQLGKLEKFQIAMYASLIKSCEAKSVEIENALLCAIKNYELKKVIANSKRGNCVSEEEFEKTIDAFNLYAQTFVEKVKSGKFEPVMNKGSIYEDLDVFTECKSCNFKSVCRTTYSVAGHQLKKIGK